MVSEEARGRPLCGRNSLIDKTFKALPLCDWQSSWRIDEQVIAVLYYLCINTNTLNGLPVWRDVASAENCHPGPACSFPGALSELHWDEGRPGIAAKFTTVSHPLNISGAHVTLGGRRPEAIPDSSLTCARSTGGHFILDLSPPCVKMGLKYWPALTNTAQVRTKQLRRREVLHHGHQGCTWNNWWARPWLSQVKPQLCFCSTVWFGW